MNNLLKVLFVAVGLAVLSSKVIANNDDPYKDAIPTPLPSTYSDTTQSLDEVMSDEYKDILEDFARLEADDPENDTHTLEITFFPRDRSNSSNSFESLMGVIKSLPEGSYSGFRYNQYDSMVTLITTKQSVEYIYSLGTMYLMVIREEETG